MFEQRYKQLYNQILPSNVLVADLVKRADAEKSQLKPLFFKKRVMIFTSVVVCFILSFPVVASNSKSIYELMYLVSPGIAQNFKPIEKVCVDNGIKMEVVSIYIHDDIAEVYITIQDLNGDRLDETTDLYDSYAVKSFYDTENYCEFVGYDKVTKTATFLLNIKSNGLSSIYKHKVTFSVKNFLSGKKYYKDIEIPITLSKVKIADNVRVAQNITGSWGNNIQDIPQNGEVTVLSSQKPMEEFPVEGIELTAIGYIDDKLHIQTAVKDVLDNDNHGYFYLKDFTGNTINCEQCISFDSTYEVTKDRVSYSEYIFDIPQSNIYNYTLYGNFTTAENMTKGNWHVTFSLEE